MRRDTDQFIKEARDVHGDRYSYGKTEYLNANTKLIITCKIHGDFAQWPGSHLSGSGCRKCGVEKVRSIYAGRRNPEIIEEFKRVHGDKYDYSKVQYKSVDSKVIIICPVHGEFMQSPRGHLNMRYGCPQCGADKLNEMYDRFEYEPLHLIGLNCESHGSYNVVMSIAHKGCPECDNSQQMYLKYADLK